MTVALHRRSLLANAGSLVGAQAVAMVIPLLTVPYLARTLRPSGWAAVLVAQALANWLVLLIEYGFDLTGTRSVSQARHAPDSMGHVVGAVQGAKLLLLPLAAAITLALVVGMPTLRDSALLLGWALLFAVCRGLSPLWYFQGVERMRGAVALDTAARAAAALGVFVFVHSPEDGWRVLALQATFAALSLAMLTGRMMREVAESAPSLRAGVTTLQQGAGVFGVRAASGFTLQANTLLVAALSTASSVAFYGGAERIVRASTNLLQPLTQAFLPRLSYLSVVDPGRGRRTVIRCLVLIGGLGALFGVVALVGAPLLAHVLLGPGYDGAIPVLRALAALPPLVAVNTVLGLYWAVPFGHERGFLAAVLGGAAVNVMLALLLAPRLGAQGMAIAVVAAELTTTVGLATLFHRRRETVGGPAQMVPAP